MASAGGGGRTPGRASVHVCWLLAFCLIGAGRAGKRKEKSDDERHTVKMTHHSFAAPMDYGVLLDDWAVSGASIFETERLLLHPGVTDRTGFAWSKQPLLTNDFQVIFHLRVSGGGPTAAVQGEVPSDQALAFWYVDENMSKALDESRVIKARSWTEGILEQGFGFVGSKGTFTGTGVVLSMANKALDKGVQGSYIAGITNDGSQTYVYGEEAPVSECRFDFRNTLNAAQVKIRFRPDAIEGYMKQSPSLSWQDCFVISRTNDPVKPGGYIGFTARSGMPSGNVKSDSVSIVEVDVVNFDENVIGEDMKDVTSKIQDAYRDMLTDDHRHFVDQKSQTDHLLRLTTVISEHIAVALPADDQLWKQVAYLDRRMSRLNRDCKTFVTETSLLAGTGSDPTAHKDAVEKLKTNIVGIRTLLERESATHKKKMESIERSAGEVKAKMTQAMSKESLAAIEKQSASITKTVRVRGTQMVIMTVVLLGVIVAIGFLMWNRMNYYEKKHFT